MSRIKLVLVLAMAVWFSCAAGLGAQVNQFGPAEAYVVKKGDTAASIAKQHYGKASLGAKLWEANKNLVAHPKRLTVGDTIYLFPESTLKVGKATAVPPPPQEKPEELYDRGNLLDVTFPKYFNFIADGRGLGGAGVMRIKVKKADPQTKEVIENTFEIREVGAVIASAEHPGIIYKQDGADVASKWGKTLLSTNDEIMVRFSEDVAKILDSDTYGDSDPYFREFPIYGKSYNIRESGVGRVDYGQSTADLYKFKGVLTIVARVEGLAPIPPRTAKALKRRGSDQNQDVEPVTYVGRVTYTEDAVELDDRIFLFVPLSPGLERQLEPAFVGTPDGYVSLGD